MNTTLRVSSNRDSIPSQRGGAILSETKSGYGRPRGRRISCAPIGAAYIGRKLVTVVSAAALCVGLAFCSSLRAGAWQQDDSTKPAAKTGESSDETAQDDSTKSEEKETKKKKKPGETPDIKRLEDMPLPAPMLREYKRGERSQRPPSPALTIVDPKPWAQITAAEKKKFDELRKTDLAKKEDAEFVEDYVRRQMNSLSTPFKDIRDWQSSVQRKYREEIEQFLDNPNMHEKFLAAYKSYVKKYGVELLYNHLWTRVNAMKILSKLRDEDMLRGYCAQIRDPDQHEAVKFFGLEGIEQLGQRKLIRQVGLENEAVATSLEVLDSGNYQPRTRMAAVRALGAIGRPSLDSGFQQDVKVAVALLKFMRDPNIRRSDRVEAMNQLAGLQIPQDLDYNFQYVAYEIAQFAAEAAAAAYKNPAVDDLHTHIFLVEASFALAADKSKNALADRAKKHQIAGSKRHDVYIRTLADSVKDLTISALKVFKPDKAVVKVPEDVPGRIELARKMMDDPANKYKQNLEALLEVLKTNTPHSYKLTPGTEELGPPPALVGPKIPPKDSKEEADEAKEKVSPTPGENGPPDP